MTIVVIHNRIRTIHLFIILLSLLYFQGFQIILEPTAIKKPIIVDFYGV